MFITLKFVGTIILINTTILFPFFLGEKGAFMDEQALQIQKTGVRLLLSQETIAAAIAYCNKFKAFGPYSSFSPLEYSSACIFLASKVADETRKIRDILNCWNEAMGKSFDTELTKELLLM